MEAVQINGKLGFNNLSGSGCLGNVARVREMMKRKKHIQELKEQEETRL